METRTVIRAETGLGLLCAGALLGFICGATIGRPDEAVAAPMRLSIPPDGWPVEITTRDVDGKDVRLRFSCVGERR